MKPEGTLPSSQKPTPCATFHSQLAPRPTPKLEDCPLSAVRNCLFSIFAAFR